MIQTILILLGLSVLLRPFLNIASSLWHHFRTLKLKPVYGQGWAVITGATDGIGFGFCQVLAQQGFNICLISRSQQKLTTKVKQLQKQFGTNLQYKTIKADFKQSNQKGFLQSIIKQLETIKIVLLINNVGYANIKKFDEQGVGEIRQIVAVNCTPMAVLSSYVMERWIRQGIKGGIVNISSQAFVIPMPYMGSYAATKAFNDSLSRLCSKQLQLRKITNINVLSVRAMLVSSGSVKRQKSLLVPTSRECAEDSLKYLGYREYTAGHIKHEIISNITTLIPEFLMKMIIFQQSSNVLVEFGVKKQ